MVLATLVPPQWCTQWLTGPWSESRGPTLIVLTGGSLDDGTMSQASYWRSVYAVDVWKEGGVRHVIVSGERPAAESIRDWLVWRGVPTAAIQIEGHSGTTRKNAVFTAGLLREFPGPYVLLTSDYHMWRARWGVFLDTVVEISKIGFYKLRGWI